MVRMASLVAGTIGYRFAAYALFPDRRELVLGDQPITLGSRAFDLLVLLVEATGGVVSKDAIIEKVWAGVVVEENNIQVQVSALRRALADVPGAIQTVPRRGYRFALPVELMQPTAAEVPPASAAVVSPGLAPPLGELIGRERDLEQVTDLLAAQRLVTVVGAGGMGKTRLALEAARKLQPAFPDGTFLVELAVLTDGGAVQELVRSALGLSQSHGGDPIPGASRVLEDKRLLVVLDNCEHVIDAAARVAEWLLRSGSAVHVLATSRESLRAEEEAVYRLSGLGLPPPDTSPADALFYPSVRLFVARAKAADSQLQIDPQMAAQIEAICGRLDGMPLAMELAAAHVAEFGVEGVVLGLHDRLELLTGGKRTALPRQRTLRATLDWSFNLLSPEERIMLRRLCVFPASFDLDAARAVALLRSTDKVLPPSALAGLVSHSLVIKETVGGLTLYRVLETTREYGLEKLAAEAETDLALSMLAGHFLQRLGRIEDLPSVPAATFLVGNLRALLDWAFEGRRAVDLGIELTELSSCLWLHLSLDREFADRAALAVAHLTDSALNGSRTEMRLRTALATALLNTEGPSRRSVEAWHQALALARAFGDREYETRALGGLASCAYQDGDFTSSLKLALEVREADRAGGSAADFLMGAALHSLARLDESRLHLERSVRAAAAYGGATPPARFGIETGVASTAMLARVNWLLGLPDPARLLLRTALAEARRLNHANTLCGALEVGVLLAIRLGDYADADRRLAELRSVARTHGLLIWDGIARWLEGWLTTERGEPETGVEILRRTMEASGAGRGRVRVNLLAANLAAALGRTGAPREGLEVIRASIAEVEVERDGVNLFMPEHLRLEGELMGLAEPHDEQAEARLRRAIGLARTQGVVAYELRAVSSLALLLRRLGRFGEMRDSLSAICSRYRTEDDTSDLRVARALIE